MHVYCTRNENTLFKSLYLLVYLNLALTVTVVQSKAATSVGTRTLFMHTYLTFLTVKC